MNLLRTFQGNIYPKMLKSRTKLLEKSGLSVSKNRSGKPLAHQYYYSNFTLPLPLFNVEFRKPQFLGERLGATNNIGLVEGGGESRLRVFSHKEALELNFSTVLSKIIADVYNCQKQQIMTLPKTSGAT